MTQIVVTVDLDWACEPAVEYTLQFLGDFKIIPTLFITHRSPAVEASMNSMEVGLHPYFATDSSHGSDIKEVVKYVMALPHNVAAFRCHRYAICNNSKQAMLEAGMRVSSNVCTDLQQISPFRDRSGLIEVPIFLEDGGYLWHRHSLELSPGLTNDLGAPGTKVLNIHPMHVAVNSPNFSYMSQIKQSLNRQEWQQLSQNRMQSLMCKQRGIRDFLSDLFSIGYPTVSLSQIAAF